MHRLLVLHGGDGVVLLSASHPTTNGLQSNVLATAADLSETSLESILIQISDMKDDRGLRIAAQGTQLIIPTAYTFVAERLLESQLRTGTADNDINAIRSQVDIYQRAITSCEGCQTLTHSSCRQMFLMD